MVGSAAGSTDLNAKIIKQGELVRDLKAKKADKPTVEAAVKLLLSLKADYKQATGQDWKPGAVTAVASPAPSASDSNQINEQIVKQGNLVRDLKEKKAGKPEVEAAVKQLLSLKADYKKATGKDWTPGAVTTSVAVTTPVAIKTIVTPPSNVAQINDKIVKQGDLVRDLKAKKADKAEIDTAVKTLLILKVEYKTASGKDWKPTPVAAVTVPTITVVAHTGSDQINEQIVKQGDLVRDLKTKKASKADIDVAVKTLLALKGDFKKASGKDWKQPSTPVLSAPIMSSPSVVPVKSDAGASISDSITKQGELVRDLKAKKSDKPTIDTAVKALLALKESYKKATGQDWKPVPAVSTASSAPSVQTTASTANNSDSINAAIAKQGDIVRDLKTKKSSKPEIDEAVKELLKLKADYKSATGQEWKPAAGTEQPASRTVKPPKAKPAPQPKAKEQQPSSGNTKKQTRLGIEVAKDENLSEWYSQVLTKSELIEYYDVSGCYILRPWAMSIWRFIQKFFDDEITKLGVKEVYFPMFVSKAALEKEKSHIADFSPEVAWVTKSGDSDLAEPIAIRPTSETIMYPAFAKWIQSYRDLPLRVNQWSNVVRWEFKHPQPFLRTREFLWQEGHTAYANLKDCEDEVLVILGKFFFNSILR